MKKFLMMILALGMTFAFVACGGGKDGDSTSSQSAQPSESSATSSEEESWEEFVPDYSSTSDVVEYFSGKTGAHTYNTGKDLTIASSYDDEPIYIGGESESNVFTIDGGEYFDRTLTVVGNGGGVVQANGGVLVLKNLIIENETHAFSDNYYRDYYAEFGGKVRFENCTISCPVQLRNDAQAEFINCEIVSSKNDEYGVWLADGSATFDNCEFSGYRALKVHEISGMDVVNLAVKNTTFSNISEKPAIAIDIDTEMSTTTISFENCDIYNCAPAKKGDGTFEIDGVDGFYESIQPTTTYTFTATECYLDNSLFSFEDGEMIYLDEV